MTCIVCTCQGAWELARRMCMCVCEGPVACVHDSLDIAASVWESHSCSGGFRPGSPQCYSSCQLWFPSPRSSSAALPSLPLMPSECFPFRLLPCFPSIAPDGSMCGAKKQRGGWGDADGLGRMRGLWAGVFLLSHRHLALVFLSRKLAISAKVQSMWSTRVETFLIWLKFILPEVWKTVIKLISEISHA